MREWITLIEETHDHPHARGEDEWFNALFGMVRINVDAIKRAVESGKITPQGPVQYPVKQMMETIYQMDESLFGSKELEDPPGTKMFDMMGPPVERKRLASIPDEKMQEPVYFVMMNSDEAMALCGLPVKDRQDKERPQIIDGNHRLFRRYIEGDTGTATCHFISWADTKKFTVSTRAETTLADIEAQRSRRR